MYVIIHTFQTTLGSKGTTISVCKTIPVELYDENTLSVVVFTKTQAAVDYIDSLYENSKVTYKQRESMIFSIYEQLGNYMVGRPYKMWCIKHEY